MQLDEEREYTEVRWCYTKEKKHTDIYGDNIMRSEGKCTSMKLYKIIYIKRKKKIKLHIYILHLYTMKK